MAKGKSSAKNNAPAAEGTDPVVLLKNYQSICKLIGTKIEPSVVAIITCENEEKATAPEQICLDIDLGPGGVRAIIDALIGGVDKNGASTAYKLINTMRFWRSNILDEGAKALARYLLKSGPESPLKFLQILDSKIGPIGCDALGDALSLGGNNRLLTLQLDHNDRIGSLGVKELCRGLRSNSVIKKLGLSYCAIGADGGKPLYNLLKYKASALEDLNLHGNRLQGDGLVHISHALMKNTALKKLDFGDNDVGPDINSLSELSKMVATNKTLQYLEFAHNGIEEKGALALLNSGSFSKEMNSTLMHFTIDIDISDPVFQALLRISSGGGKKKGGKKKGKKK